MHRCTCHRMPRPLSLQAMPSPALTAPAQQPAFVESCQCHGCLLELQFASRSPGTDAPRPEPSSSASLRRVPRRSELVPEPSSPASPAAVSVLQKREQQRSPGSVLNVDRASAACPIALPPLRSACQARNRSMHQAQFGHFLHQIRPRSACLHQPGPPPMVSSTRPSPVHLGLASFGPCRIFFQICDFSNYPGFCSFTEKTLIFMHLITHEPCIGLKCFKHVKCLEFCVV